MPEPGLRTMVLKRSGQILLGYSFSYLVGNRVNDVMYPMVVDNKVTFVFVL